MTGRIAAIAMGSLLLAAAGIFSLTSLAGHHHAARLTAHIATAPSVINVLVSHRKVPARDAFSGRITARTGVLQGDRGHATADLAVTGSRAATRRLTITIRGRLCDKSKHCVGLTGHLKGTITALADTIPDIGRSFTIRAAGVIRRFGHVRVSGRVDGTGFIARGHESLHLTATGHAGRLALYAQSRLVPGFTSP
jgi:hypothetical protein